MIFRRQVTGFESEGYNRHQASLWHRQMAHIVGARPRVMSVCAGTLLITPVVDLHYPASSLSPELLPTLPEALRHVPKTLSTSEFTPEGFGGIFFIKMFLGWHMSLLSWGIWVDSQSSNKDYFQVKTCQLSKIQSW